MTHDTPTLRSLWMGIHCPDPGRTPPERTLFVGAFVGAPNIPKVFDAPNFSPLWTAK